MSKINVVTVTNGQNISAINANFAAIATHLNNLVSYRNSPVGEPNEMHNDIDFNSFRILNLSELNVTSLVVDGIAIDDAIFETEANAQAAANSALSAANSAAQAAASVANSLSKANNLSDVASPSVSRTNLGLGNVDNTTDLNKPISTATAAALALKAPLASPAFTGTATFASTPTAPNYALNNTAGSGRVIVYQTVAANRWQVGVDGAAESGSNAGSNFTINAYSDAGTFLNAPISIVRSTGAVTLAAIPLAPGYTIDTAVGARNLTYNTSGSNRWTIATTGTAESGSNVGSDLAIRRFSDAGAFIDAPIAITRSTGKVEIKGTNSNDFALTGFVGEFLELTNTGVAMTNNTNTDIATLSLTAGDWDVSGLFQVNPAATTTWNFQQFGLSTTSVTFGAFGSTVAIQGYTSTAAALTATPCPVVRISIATTTTVRLVAKVVYAVSTLTGSGYIRARRVR